MNTVIDTWESHTFGEEIATGLITSLKITAYFQMPINAASEILFAS